MNQREPEEEIRILRSQLYSLHKSFHERRIALARVLWPHWPDATHNATTWEMIESEIQRIKKWDGSR